MQKILEPKFAKGQFVTTSEGTGRIISVNPRRLTLCDGSTVKPANVEVRLDRGDSFTVGVDEITSCDR